MKAGRWLIFCGLFGLLAFSVPGRAQRTKPLRMGAAANSIRQVLARSVAAWNRGDLDAFLASYRNSPQTIYIGSTGLVRGWQAIRARYVKAYASGGRGKMGLLTFTHLEILPLDASHALAIGQWHLERTRANGGDIGGFFTLTFQKTRAGWRIIVDHTS